MRLRYDGLDSVERNVTVHFSPAPDALSVDRADYTLTIAAQACVSIYLTVDATLGPAHAEGPDAAASRCAPRSSACTARCARGVNRWRA